jgi:hypothetical protein
MATILILILFKLAETNSAPYQFKGTHLVAAILTHLYKGFCNPNLFAVCITTFSKLCDCLLMVVFSLRFSYS